MLCISTSDVPRGTSDGPGLRLRAAVRSDIGARDRNEDAAHIDDDGLFYMVADGMGGQAAGEVASMLAMQVVEERLDAARPHLRGFALMPTDTGREMVAAILECAVRGAHHVVRRQAGRDRTCRGMGTTIDVAVLVGGEAFVAHVGDGRAYLIRDRRAVQLTRDHTVAELMVGAGALSIEDAPRARARTVLCNAIGASAHVTVELSHFTLRAGDRLLLCSDGLHEALRPHEIAARAAGRDPDQALVELVAAARQRGGHDNMTGVLVEAMTGRDSAW